MNTQILTYFHLEYQPASTVLLLLLLLPRLLLCVHVHLSVYVCKYVIMWWVGMWGNKSALSS